MVAAADEVLEWQRAIGGAEIAVNLRREWETGRDKLSAALRARIEHGRGVLALDYLEALGRIPPLVASLTDLFEQRYDAILTPAAFGTAPKGLESTGDPAFCAVWTLCGMPALNVPAMRGANGYRSALSWLARPTGMASFCGPRAGSRITSRTTPSARMPRRV